MKTGHWLIVGSVACFLTFLASAGVCWYLPPQPACGWGNVAMNEAWTVAVLSALGTLGLAIGAGVWFDFAESKK